LETDMTSTTIHHLSIWSSYLHQQHNTSS